MSQDAAALTRFLDLREPANQKELYARLPSFGVYLDPAALQYALSVLSEDWFQLPPALLVCSLEVGVKRSEGITLAQWASVIQGVYEFKDDVGFPSLLPRLRLSAHEKVNTAFVVQIAHRYCLRGFGVTFEPFGAATTDLLLRSGPYQWYVEIKRENSSEHKRFIRTQAIGSTMNAAFSHLQPWLQERQLRLEVKLTKLFSDHNAQSIIREVSREIEKAKPGFEIALKTSAGGTMIVLPKEAEFFYRKGLHSGAMLIGTDKPTLLFAPASSPVRVTFPWKPNLEALGLRIREAGRQLARDLKRNEQADGFLVLEVRSGDDSVVEAIQHRFWPRLPARCWGVTLIGQRTCVIPHPALTPEQAQILTYAALDPSPAT